MSEVGSIGISGNEEEIYTKKLMCATDLHREFTWQEIDGVRRVIKIEFTSASLDSQTGFSIALTRDFNYQSSEPFDLVEVVDSLTVA